VNSWFHGDAFICGEIRIAIAIGILISIPILISGMTHPNPPGYLADAVR